MEAVESKEKNWDLPSDTLSRRPPPPAWRWRPPLRGFQDGFPVVRSRLLTVNMPPHFPREHRLVQGIAVVCFLVEMTGGGEGVGMFGT